ncbi:galactokinase [Dermabacter sp. p3-SID358]|uniref:galactokinase n=1 Tax=Dermabacter sp. p3-SID358 TaxID=2916114 RepID=UPI0021A30293|nr:galactokinase [Dermabacter sp. p3-SID358]MCT1867217.1 galactokinase [Dermabacter sp. p3-SID358]
MTELHAAPVDTDAIEKAAREFRETFGAEPEGMFSAPGRVNIIGEHVDYQQGLCLPMAISHRCFVAARRTDTGVVRMRSVQSGETVEAPVEGLEPGAVDGWASYVAGVLWALADRFEGGAPCGFDLLIDGYVPLGAGLSSSAALECAVAAAVDELCELGTSAHERIRAAIKAETEFAGAATGGLDQSASILCEEGHAILLDCRDFSTVSVPWDLAGQGLELLIIDTRAPHSLVGGEYAERRAQAEAGARTLGVESLRDVPFEGASDACQGISDPVVHKRSRHIIGEIERVREFAEILEAGSIREGLERIAELLNASHDSLRDDYEVSVPELDVAVDAAREAGAHGARMTGGGFGGSVIALVDAEMVEDVASAVQSAFAKRALAEPVFFLAAPSRGAGRDR